MTLIVAGRLIQTNADLSELARRTLTFIDGGPQWLDWAISNAGARYELPDEMTLVDGIQQGLHACPMTLLTGIGLWISPVKLMSLGTGTLRTLAKAESGDTSESVREQLQRILAEHRLVTADQWCSVTAFLQELSVESAHLFQAGDFNDRVELLDLADLAVPAALRKEGASWALEQARTVPEFCDYYQAYLAHASKMKATEGPADARAALAQGALETLLPLAFGALDCPQLPDRLPSPTQVEQCLHGWLAAGKRLGFARLSQAVLQIVTQTSFTTETGDEARRLFERYLSQAQSFLSSKNHWKSQLAQDGATLVFDLTPSVSTGDHAQLHVSAGRVLSLRQFGTRADAGELEALPASHELIAE